MFRLCNLVERIRLVEKNTAQRVLIILKINV